MARRPTGFDGDGSLDTAVITKTGVEGAQHTQPTDAIQSIGPGAIGKVLQQRNAATEFPLAHLPKTIEVRNRAQLGNVKVWSGGFDSVMYPEEATEDRTTWLQPGESMILPLEAALHFFGNIFNPNFENAVAVIEACGGFQIEPRGEMHPDAKNIPPPRIIGGPLFLPDFIITGKDGRGRVTFGPWAIYEAYDKLTRRLRRNPILQNQSLKEQEAQLLEERLAEYRTADAALFDQHGNRIQAEFSEPPAA